MQQQIKAVPVPLLVKEQSLAAISLTLSIPSLGLSNRAVFLEGIPKFCDGTKGGDCLLALHGHTSSDVSADMASSTGLICQHLLTYCTNEP